MEECAACMVERAGIGKLHDKNMHMGPFSVLFSFLSLSAVNLSYCVQFHLMTKMFWGANFI
jgi:hypothetical protein